MRGQWCFVVLLFCVIAFAVMAVSVIGIHKLARRFGLELDQRALFLCAALALVVNFTAIKMSPYLTERHYWLLGALILTATLVVTLFQGYISSRPASAPAFDIPSIDADNLIRYLSFDKLSLEKVSVAKFVRALTGKGTAVAPGVGVVTVDLDDEEYEDSDAPAPKFDDEIPEEQKKLSPEAEEIKEAADEELLREVTAAVEEAVKETSEELANGEAEQIKAVPYEDTTSENVTSVEAVNEGKTEDITVETATSLAEDSEPIAPQADETHFDENVEALSADAMREESEAYETITVTTDEAMPQSEAQAIVDTDTAELKPSLDSAPSSDTDETSLEERIDDVEEVEDEFDSVDEIEDSETAFEEIAAADEDEEYETEADDAEYEYEDELEEEYEYEYEYDDEDDEAYEYDEEDYDEDDERVAINIDVDLTQSALNDDGEEYYLADEDEDYIELEDEYYDDEDELDEEEDEEYLDIAAVKKLSTLDEYLDYAQQMKDAFLYKNASFAYEQALAKYYEDDYAPYIVIDMANINKTIGEYKKAIAVYELAFTLKSVRNSADIREDFIKALSYLEAVEYVLTKHGYPNLPYAEIPPECLSEIEGEFRRRQRLN